MFAYDDDGGRRVPRAVSHPHCRLELTGDIWALKRRIVGEIYGFGAGSFEMRAAGPTEAFWCFGEPRDVKNWVSFPKND
jgi:hypothetical protein